MIGAVHLSGGLESSAGVVHLLFDPLIEAASAMGAGLDWKTSLQELSAEHGLGVPEYLIADEGPDHMKTFTAQVRVADRRYGNGVGRSKKEAEQAAAETAYGELVSALNGARRAHATPARLTCPSCPRSRPSVTASNATWSATPSGPSRSSIPDRSAVTPAARPASPPHSPGAGSTPHGGAASTSGCPSTTATPCSAISA